MSSRSSRWVRVGRAADRNGKGPFTAWAEGSPLVVLRAASGWKAYEGRCPHRGALLGEGEIEGTDLVCKNHGWRFATETGHREGGTECLSPCSLREEGGELEVEIPPNVEKETVARELRTLDELPGPPRLPIVGSAYLLEVETLHRSLEGWAKKYGTPFTYRFGSRRVLVLSDLEDMSRVFRERPALFRRVSTIEPIFRELGVAGVFSAEGDAWKPQRRLSMEALASRHLRGFYPTLAKIALRLQQRWSGAAERGEPLDMPDELQRFTVDVTTLLVFGYDINTLENDSNVIQDKLALLFPTFARRMFSIVPWWRVVRLPKDRRVDRAVKELSAWIGDRVAQTRRSLEIDPTRGERPEHFLEAMVAAKDDAGKSFDDETIFGNAMTMLLAGEDTTAYSIAWAEHLLLDAPAEVAALREEADRVLGGATVPADFDAATRLLYAGAVANESMRLHPVAPVFISEACEDTTVGNIEVPRGTQIALLARAQSIDAKNFAEPLAFRPSRWLSPLGGPHEAGAHQPFGSGPRICPGRSLALLEMKIVLATLHENFDVERVGSARDVREVFSFTMRPSELRVRLTQRPGTRRGVEMPSVVGSFESGPT